MICRWPENIPVDQYNNTKLAQIPKPMFTLKVTDQYPNNVNKQDIDSQYWQEEDLKLVDLIMNLI